MNLSDVLAPLAAHDDALVAMLAARLSDSATKYLAILDEIDSAESVPSTPWADTLALAETGNPTLHAQYVAVAETLKSLRAQIKSEFGGGVDDEDVKVLKSQAKDAADQIKSAVKFLATQIKREGLVNEVYESLGFKVPGETRRFRVSEILAEGKTFATFTEAAQALTTKHQTFRPSDFSLAYAANGGDNAAEGDQITIIVHGVEVHVTK